MRYQKIPIGTEAKQVVSQVQTYAPVPYDNQAETYDQRVGLRERDCRQIARKVLSLAEVTPGDVVVEIGAGTGQIGQWFAYEGHRYIGFDLSQNMLDIFQSRMKPQDSSLLCRADGNCPWPIADAAAHVIFSSRAIHLLVLDHVVHEVFRIAKADHAILVIGRVQRQSNSVKARMKQALRQQLYDHGVPGHDGEQNQRRLIQVCCEHDAQMLDPLVVSRWSVTHTPWQSINNWQMKQGLGGINVSSSQKQVILKELKRWADQTFNGLHQPVESEEAYVLQGVRLYPSRNS
ncbi:MAG: methyltransferase domain-containing protein [Nitrospirales bacterium]|nr:methyltransferase domain-containing protein [Nitrospirales bacterium]